MRVKTFSLTTTVSIFFACQVARADSVTAGTETSTTNPASKFHLSAQVNQRPQLSRNELDATAIAPAKKTGAAPTISFAAPQQSGFKNQSPLSPSATATLDNTPVDAAHAALLEHNVDWSGWVSKFADRWFYVLRTLESGMNAEFVTERAALFQFTCYDDGRINNVILRQSSGNVIYDHLQMLALVQTAPLPQFPAGTKRHSITLILGWESHIKQPGEEDYTPGSFGKNFPLEKVREWVTRK